MITKTNQVSPVAQYIASAMDKILKSEEHQKMFGTKVAHEMCSKCHHKMDECQCDSMMADDKKEHEKTTATSDSNSADMSDKDTADSSYADDANDARKKKMCDKCDKPMSLCDCDKSDASDGSSEMESSASFDVAIDSLLTASAALDNLGFEKGSAFSLKLASMVVEAKKKDDKKKKDTKKSVKKDDKSKKDDKKSSSSGSKSSGKSTKK